MDVDCASPGGARTSALDPVQPTYRPTDPSQNFPGTGILEKDKIDDLGSYLIFFVQSTPELLKEVGRLVGWMLTGLKGMGFQASWKAFRTVGGLSDMTEMYGESGRLCLRRQAKIT